MDKSLDSERPLRIAHFIHRYPPALGGSEDYFARLSSFLKEQGHEVTVHTTTALDLEAFWQPDRKQVSPGLSLVGGARAHRHRLLHFPGQRYVLKLLSLLPLGRWRCLCMAHNPIAPSMWSVAERAKTRPDVVHATAFPYGWPLMCAWRMARRHQVPFVLTPFLHAGDPENPNDPTRRGYTQPALISLAKSAAAILAQTPVEKSVLVACGIDSQKIHVQGMGVDVENCTGGDRSRARATWGIAENEIVIGHLANNSWQKGTEDLLRASAKAQQRGVEHRLVLAGPQMSGFLRFWKRFSQRRHARLLGPLSEQEKKDFFAALDVFALPSRSDSFGIVLLEAWVNGVPNVGYRAGGIADVIRHQQDGLLVRCGDVEGLSEALITLARNREMRQRFGQAGQARALRDFRWPDKLMQVETLYRDLARSQ